METFKVLLSPGEDGFIIAEALELPGCISQGKTPSEAIENIKDAIQGYIETVKEHGGSIRKMELREVEVEATF